MPTPDAAAAEKAMDFDAVLRGRRSVRAFLPDPVPDSVLKDLIEAATWAPSAVNAQSTIYFVIRDQTLLNRMSLAAQAHVLSHLPAENAPKQFRELVDDDDFHIFYHAPALVIVAARAASEWAAEDCALAAQNLMLAARARGLGSCWIGFAQHWLATPEGHAMLGISEDLQPIAPIVIGWPKAWPSAPPRRPARIRWIG
ncbi:MAG: nitroreductase family protein [Rhodospirillaceae bacterium]